MLEKKALKNNQVSASLIWKWLRKESQKWPIYGRSVFNYVL